MKMKKNTLFWATIVVMVAIIGVLGYGYYTEKAQLETYGTTLQGMYERSFYELVSNVNDLEIKLSKAIISSDNKSKQDNFYELWEESSKTQGSLASLPVSNQVLMETTRFVNQLGGYSYYLFDKLNNGEDLTSEDNNSLIELHSQAVSMQKTVTDFVTKLNYNYNLIDNLTSNEAEVSFVGLFEDVQTATVDSPTLIYDGPFSDSVLNKEVKGLTGELITQVQAEEKIRQELKNYGLESVKYLNKTSGKFTTFNFEIYTDKEKTLYVQITEDSGFILTISAYNDNSNGDLSLTEMETLAENFATNLGLENMQAVWSTSINDIGYVSLATITEGVIVYPEMIKVKICSNSGMVCGWEATNYLYNKQNRSNLTPSLGATTAQSKISDALMVQTIKLAVIPQEYDDDVLTYEFKCKLNDYTYYVYIDALSGEQKNILRIVQTTDGNLLM